VISELTPAVPVIDRMVTKHVSLSSHGKVNGGDSGDQQYLPQIDTKLDSHAAQASVSP
jgi:hypothetical protein